MSPTKDPTEGSTEDSVQGSTEDSVQDSKRSSTTLPLTALLIVGCGGLGLYAALASPTGTSVSSAVGAPTVADERVLPPHDRAADSGPHANASGGALSGRVKEVLQVSNYTYLRVEPREAPEFWAAVTKSNTSVGALVVLEGAELMTNFSSKELDRTFERIYFGRLASGAGLDPHGGGEFPAPTAEEGQAAKKAAAMVAEEIPLHASSKAEGPLGRTVAEIFEKRASLAKQKVRVRGTIVKVTRRVMGTNFLHVRDGSGKPGDGSHDIAVKLDEEPPALGDEVVLEASVAVNVDLGAGYSYPVLLEGAHIISSP